MKKNICLMLTYLAIALHLYGADPLVFGPLSIHISTQLGGFLGDRSSGDYQATGISFLGHNSGDSENLLPLDSLNLQSKDVLDKNPLLLVSSVVALEKSGNASKLISFIPPEKASEAQGYFAPDVVKKTVELLSDVSEIKPLLIIKQDDKLYVYYALVKPNGTVPQLAILKQIGPVYWLAVESVGADSPLLCNIYNALYAESLGNKEAINVTK